MRPVRLELNGFASFRDRAVVDFTDTDYFALVGPTGSGKSTILDALTFALYGTAARWGSRNAIAYALAPTSNRCTVALTFDIGAQRYQVAREVRRVGKTISQKAVSLVRFLDSTVVDNAQTEVIAGEIKELNTAVENLLGLSFEDFCQCVVLPQGEFARFLTASSADRQKILLKLLGADHYEGVGKRAGLLATEAAQKVQVLTEQLGRHADVTPERLTLAQQHSATLVTAADRVDALLPHVEAARDRAAAATAAAATARAETGILTSVVMPDGVGELQSGVDLAQRAAVDARREADEAAQQLADASAAAQAGPQRAALVAVQDRHEERDRLTVRRAEVDATTTQAQVQLDRSVEAVVVAEKSVRTAREVLDDLRNRHQTARLRAEALGLRRDRLAAITAPPGISDLADRADAARARLLAADDARSTAAAALEAARTAVADAVDPSRLAEADDTLQSWIGSGSDLTRTRAEHDAATAAVATAADRAEAARTHLHRTQADLDQARVQAGAARLRPGLAIGHQCPVCDQLVATLPAPLSDPALDAAQYAHRLAAAAHEQSIVDQTEATRRADESRRQLERVLDRRDAADQRLLMLLPQRPGGDDRDAALDAQQLADLLRRSAALAETLTAAQESVRAAERDHRSATAGVAAADKDLAVARHDVAALRGSLTDLEPPAVDTDDLPRAWQALTDWAAGLRGGLADEISTATAAVAELETEGKAARRSLDQSETRLQEAADARNAATAAAAKATTERDGLAERLADLDRQLTSAPALADLPGLLAEADRLHQAVQAANTRATAARTAASAADLTLREVQLRLTRARSALTAARDAVAAIGAPSIDPDDLVLGWSTLTVWARQTAKSRAEAADLADAEALVADRQAQELVAQVAAVLTDTAVAFTGLGPRAERAPQLMAVAVERARGEEQHLQTRLAETAELQASIAEADEKRQVAAQLAQLMRANKFPQWLAESALDTLVAGASESLRRLSNDQFDLTHQKGDFFVIDHADADSQRSVRTLSGGETFQASLALALSLSDHLVGMGGTTKLESIFLDEGFGTLDPDSLETVAATLENLAQGDRMVGVITHVGGLAERAPVRFRVQRDTRTSSITRESL